MQGQGTSMKQFPYITKIDHFLGHKINRNKCKRIQVIQIVFSGHNGTELEINNRKISGKSPNIWKLSNTLQNNSWIKEVRMEIRKHFELNENENSTY